VADFPALIAELMRRGWTDADVAKVAGGNVLRVMASVEQVAARLRTQRPASEATVAGKGSP
jgi:membrane dipeptidase